MVNKDVHCRIDVHNDKDPIFCNLRHDTYWRSNVCIIRYTVVVTIGLKGSRAITKIRNDFQRMLKTIRLIRLTSVIGNGSLRIRVSNCTK